MLRMSTNNIVRCSTSATVVQFYMEHTLSIRYHDCSMRLNSANGGEKTCWYD